MLPVGVAVREFYSNLAPGYGDEGEGTAQGQVFDFGVRLEREFCLWNVVRLHPAFGLAFHSLPPDSVSYVDESDKDPLPRKRWYGASLKFDILGWFGVTHAREREYAVVDQEFIDHRGTQYNITPFFFLLRGKMTDSAGLRFEEPEGHGYRFNAQEVFDVFLRHTRLISPSLAEEIERTKGRLDDYFLKPNIYLQYVKSEIKTPDDSEHPRNGQSRKELTFGFSILGGLDRLIGDSAKRRRQRERTEEDRNITVETEDGDLLVE